MGTGRLSWCIFLLALCLVGPSARAVPTHFVGVNAHQPQTDVLDGIKDLGVSWIRIDVNWLQVQPTLGQAPDFTALDTIVSQAAARGLSVFPTLAYGPAWASEPDTDGIPTNNVPKIGEYQKFCQAFAAHFQGQLTHIGLWNEPNLDGFFEGTRQQWIDRIVVEGINGIKAGCPACKVLGPELASIGSEYEQWLDDSLTQLEQKGLMYDVITWHIYSGFLETKPGWLCWDGDLFLHDLDQHRVCFGFNGPLSVREVLLKHNLQNLPVWISETGAMAPVGDAAATARQVTYYRRVLEEQLKRAWWTHTFFYEIVDDNTIADKWGLAVRSGASPTYPASYQKKPVWGFLHDVLAQQPALGGSGADCNDGLDNDGDKLIDYPADPQCGSASDPTETPGTTVPDAGPLDTGPPDTSRDSVTGPDEPPSDAPALPRETSTVDGPRAAGDSAAATADDGCSCSPGGRPAAVGPTALMLLAAIAVLLARRRPGRRTPGC